MSDLSRSFCERKVLHFHLSSSRHPFSQTTCKNITVKPMNVTEFKDFLAINWPFSRFPSKFRPKLWIPFFRPKRYILRFRPFSVQNLFVQSLVIIGPYTLSEKCFNTPVENTLCRCQFGVKWGKKIGVPLLDFDPQRKDTFV